MSITKIKKILIIFMVCIIFFSLFSPWYLTSVIGAEEEEETVVVNELSGLLEMGDIASIENMIKYDEDLQLHITKEMLKSTTPFDVPGYANIFNGGEAQCSNATTGPCYTNSNIVGMFQSVMENGDELSEAQKNSKSIYRLPINFIEGTDKIKLVEEGNTEGVNTLTARKLIYEKDDVKFKGEKGVFVVNESIYSVFVGNEVGVINLSSLAGYSPYKKKPIKKEAIVLDNVTETNGWDLLGHQDTYGSNYFKGSSFLLMRNAFIKLNKSIPDYDVTLFLDSYGNIVTNDSKVLIPYWMNESVPLFNEKLSEGLNKSYMSTHLNLVVSAGGERFLPSMVGYMKANRSYFHEVAAAKSGNVVHFKDEDMRTEFNKLFSTHEYNTLNIVKDGDESLKRDMMNIYSKDSKYLDLLAVYIVAKTKKTVETYNKDLLNLLKDSQKENKSLKVSVDDSTFRQAGNGLDTLDDAQKYINDASTIMAKISRILDVGLFELMRLTIASFVSDFYNSNMIRFSVSDVFHTSLLSDSVLWNQLVNTVLLLTVSFTSLYIIYLSLRMFMGTVTPKEIMMKIIILAIAVASPMILYSPIVNLLFNVPAEKILNTEMNRMMLLDTWLNDKENLNTDYEELTGYNMNNLRDRQEDYTVEFVTTTTVDGKKISDLKNDLLPEPSKQQMITVDVSVFHIMLWLNSMYGDENSGGGSEEDPVETYPVDTTLFEYLLSNSDTERFYRGLENYEEYNINLGTKLNGIEGFDTADSFLTASDLIRQMHEKFGSMENPIYTNLVSMTEALFYKGKDASGEGEAFTSKEIEIIISELSMTSDLRKEVLGTESLSPYVQDLLDNAVILNLGESDFLHLEEILEPLKGIRFGKEVELGTEVQDVNRKVIDKYVELYLPLRLSINNSTQQSYTRSEQMIVVLETYFAVSEYYKMGHFPKGVNIKNLSLDTYVRTMFIPLSKFVPEEKTLNDVSEYIALNVDLFSLLVFLIAIVGLFLYGLVKFIVLFVLLMPLILFSFFFNYVVKNNVNNKSWLGSLTILGSFALINLGLLGVWKGLIYAMNINDLNKSLGLSGGGYPYTITNSAALLIYLFIVFKFVLIPLYKTVKADISNLGGETFSQKFGDITSGFNKALGNMWNGNTGRGSNESLGSINLNEDKTNKGITATDTGKAGEMSIIDSEGEDGLSEKDRNSIDLINDKMESSGSVHNVLEGKTGSKGISNIVGNTKNKVSNKVSDKVNGIRDVIGNSAYNAISKTGKVVGGTTGELLGNAAGGVVRRAITGTLGDVTTGAQAAMGIAQLTNSGVGATLAGGLLGGILGKAGAKAMTPFTLLQAQAMASKLNGLKMKGSKYSKLNNMDESDLERLRLAGLDTRLEGIDGIDSNRSNELMYLDTDDMVVSQMVAKQLDKDLGAEASGNKIILNLDNEEIQDKKVYAQLLNDLVQGVYSSKQEVLESGLELSEIGDMPVAYKVGDSSYNLGALGNYTDVYNKLESDYVSRGISFQSRTDENGHKIVDFDSSKEADSFMSEFEERSTIYSEMTASRGPLYASQTMGENLLQLLDDNDIEYEVEENSKEFGTAVRLSDVHNDGEKFADLLSSNKSLSSEMIELTGGHLKSSDDVIVKQLMSKYTDSNDLIEGEDVVYRGNDVIAMSARAKQVMSTIQDNYDEERANTLAKLDDFTGKIKESLLNVEDGMDIEGGLVFGVHDRNSGSSESVSIEQSLKGTNVGKEQYVMRNDFDINEMSNFVGTIERQRLDISNGKTSEEMLPEETHLLEVVARMKSRGVKLERYDDTTLNVYTENKEDAEYVTDYFNGIREVVKAREIRSEMRNRTSNN